MLYEASTSVGFSRKSACETFSFPNSILVFASGGVKDIAAHDVAAGRT
jgi:hypothetical protein